MRFTIKQTMISAVALLALISGVQAANESIASRLLREHERASGRSMRRRLPSSASTVKKDMRAFWRHLGGNWTGTMARMPENLRDGSVTVGNTNNTTDLGQLKKDIEKHKEFAGMKGVLTEIFENLNSLLVKLDEQRGTYLKKINNERRRLVVTSTKTLKNYLRAIHMFLLRGWEGEVGKSGQKDFKNLESLKFGGTGALTKINSVVVTIVSRVEELLNKISKCKQQEETIASNKTETDRLKEELEKTQRTLEETKTELEVTRATNGSLQENNNSLREANGEFRTQIMLLRKEQTSVRGAQSPRQSFGSSSLRTPPPFPSMSSTSKCSSMSLPNVPSGPPVAAPKISMEASQATKPCRACAEGDSDFPILGLSHTCR